MSNPLSSIRAAFVTKLQAFTGLPSVAWENVPFTPATGVPYLQPMLLPAEPFQAELGTSGANRHSGIYQISVFAPSGATATQDWRSTSKMDALVGNLCDHFKRGTVLTYSGVTVTVQKAYATAPQQETDWQHVPITIQYATTVAN